MTTNPPTPRWMTFLLRAAAVYNLAWGAMAFALPTQLFIWGGNPPPNYPSIVQCLGVVIGAFGVGYWIAARDPVTHWLIVFVGLLSKVFAPIGFAWAVARGELPSIWIATILLNDVAWWLPFSAILLHVARVHSDRAGGGVVGTLTEELQRTHTAAGESLWDLSFQHPLLIVFIRHLGCTFCREALADLHQQSEKIASVGVTPVVIHMARGEDVQPLLARFGLQDVAAISDPNRRLFRAFELPLGRWNQLFGPRVLWRALVDGTVFRYGFGRIVGNPLQLTGAFLVHRGQIVRSFRHRTTADRPDYAELACSILSPLPHSDGGEG